ncbi:hypothetical protein GCM10010992_20730 [Cloacibacterium rupense]|uniref:SMI1 / KNR4 family (SUKH-1) n=1 Tax=Cloacibacterium rupense TaxID=517423 RepID=A0ABQ2NLI9_9FLAO|nr:hypothetical protein [Cloacibacterium rupense]GGP05256.1 hypothetical protein GCM10010992_20730 [Cloacibacterium rupense]
MTEIEKIENYTKELKNLVSKINFETKKKLISADKELKEILFEQPRFFYSFLDEVKLFEKKFNIKLSKKLIKAFEIANFKGFYYCELFDYNISSYCPIESFFSEEFVKILIENGLTNEEIEEGYFEYETQNFNSKKIEDIYNLISKKDNLLINYISFAECCGGRNLLILNGKDENTIAYDNHVSYGELIYNQEIYNYSTYLITGKKQTIFDIIIDEIIKVTEKLKPYTN